jgi:hypothetical protein
MVYMINTGIEKKSIRLLLHFFRLLTRALNIYIFTVK